VLSVEVASISFGHVMSPCFSSSVINGPHFEGRTRPEPGPRPTFVFEARYRPENQIYRVSQDKRNCRVSKNVVYG